MWSTGEGNFKPLQYSCLENPMNSMKRKSDRILKERLPRSVVSQYATGDQWRNNSRKNEETELKQHHPVVDVTGDRNKGMIQNFALVPRKKMPEITGNKYFHISCDFYILCFQQIKSTS